MRKPIIKKGDKFNRLTAIKFDHRDNCGSQHWLFKCDCGKEKVAYVSRVKRGDVKSCGCLKKEMLCERNRRMTTHGMFGTRTYNTWAMMKQRCNNTNHIAYKNYGERGIKVCKRWEKFENFLEDMGERPAGKTLDKIDNEKGYSKENCKWSTWEEQENNRRNNHLLTYKGKTQSVSQWAREIGTNRDTLYNRINKCNWSVKRALTIKVYEK